MLTDIRYGIRQLLKNPGFTAIAILTLALGIGACTAIFSVVNGVLLKPLDYPQPERLVVVRESQLPQFPVFSVSPPNFLDWEKQAKSFEHLAAYSGGSVNLTGENEPQRLLGLSTTAHYFEVFGIKAILGRLLLPGDDAQGQEKVVVLSYPSWQRLFAGANDVIGRVVQLNGEPHTIVGVAEQGFGLANKIDLWKPMAFTDEAKSDKFRGAHYLNVAGRLRPDVTVAQAEAELKLLATQLEKQYPDSNKGWGIVMLPMQDAAVRDVRPVLYTLLGAVGCVLFIACANIANLLLARAIARHRELSIRAALGATRARLVRQLLVESVVLSLCGGTAGLLVAKWGLDLLLSLAPAGLPRAANIHLDTTVLVFAIALSVVTGLVFGVAPALLAANADVIDALKQGARGSTDTRGKLRGALVVLEMALALVLLGGAGLLARSFMQLTKVDPGFNPAHATVLRLELPAKKYEKPEQQIAFADALLERLRILPGVEAVGLTHALPIVYDWVMTFELEGRPPVAASDLPTANYYTVTPDYFRAMGIHLLRGRLFTAQDDARAPRVAIISETLARQFFPNEEPLGKRIAIGGNPQTWREIVGIVGDIKQYGLDKPVTSQTYEPFAQRPYETLNVVLRTTGSTSALLGALRPAVYSVDKDQPIGKTQPLEEIVSETMAKERFGLVLLTIFSFVALVIAAVGIYGVMAYSVVQRTSEIGVRLALGAQRGDVLRLVLAQAGKLLGVGLVAGLIATFASGRVMSSMLFQTSAHDPVTLGAITILLAAVALLACLVPALRATKVNPIEALRAE